MSHIYVLLGKTTAIEMTKYTEYRAIEKNT